MLWEWVWVWNNAFNNGKRDGDEKQRPRCPSTSTTDDMCHADALNARSHTANLTCNQLQCYDWEVRDHPPYAPNLMFYDFHQFGSLKKHLAIK
jgi:hypothetical protein